MAMVSNKFMGALCVRLGFHKHLRSNTTVLEHQIRDYVTEIQEAEEEANGAMDYWVHVKSPPKVGSYLLSFTHLPSQWAIHILARCLCTFFHLLQSAYVRILMLMVTHRRSLISSSRTSALSLWIPSTIMEK